jgi:hypothetical protein
VALVTSADEATVERFAARWLSGEDNPLPIPVGVLALRRANLLRELDEVGGVFLVTDEKETVYKDLTDPVYAEPLVRATLEIDLDDARAVTNLVSTYGCLGWDVLLGMSGFIAPFDVKGEWRAGQARLRGALRATTRELNRFRQHVEWLGKVKSSSRAREREWGEFVASLAPFLERIRPTIRWDPHAGARPCWTVRTPRDVLWATLWDWATRGGELRRCRRCSVLFPTDHPRREFCSRICTNRASAAEWYRKKGRRLRRSHRRRREKPNTG